MERLRCESNCSRLSYDNMLFDVALQNIVKSITNYDNLTLSPAFPNVGFIALH